MSLANDQRDGFDKRIAKIRKGGSNTMGEVHIGPVDEAQVYGKKKGKATNTVRIKKKKAKNIDLTSGSTGTLTLLAVFFGGMSMFVGQAMDFHFYGAGGLLQLSAPAIAEPYMQYAPFLFGGLLALAFGWTFRLMRGVRFLGLAGGFGAVFHYKADLIQAMPGLYAGFFSKEYVEAALAAV
ncbi:MAG: hypothetical protein AAF222_11910 [Pseudomonadota bacterium]